MSANPKQNISSSKAVGTSIIVSLSDIVLNLVVALLTGSAVMLSQALQGTADLSTAVLLLIGVKRSSKKPDSSHPFGFGREIFFWTLLAGILTFSVTGLIAIAKGLQQIVQPASVEFPLLAAGMLLFGLATNAYSMRVSLKRLGSGLRTTNVRSLAQRILHSSLVETKTTLLIDLMGTLSAIIGFTSIAMFIVTGEVFFDGIGAVLVGALTISGATLLIYNLRDFIVGISPRPEIINDIRRTALSCKGVLDVLDLRAVSIGSGKILVILEIHFDDNLNTDRIEKITDTIKSKVKGAVPHVTHIQVEVETPEYQTILT